MRFGLTSSGHQTAGSSPPRTDTQVIKTHLAEIYSRRKKKCWKNQHRACHASQSEHRDQDGERAAAAPVEKIFQKLPIILCVGEHKELGRVPNGILYQTNKTSDRTCLRFIGLHTNRLQRKKSLT